MSSDGLLMLKIDKHIEIVRSSKTWLSSMSYISSEAILGVLKKKYVRVGVSIVDDLDGLKRLIDLKPDLVFLGMKYVLSLDIDSSGLPKKVWISEQLDISNINYTGSSKAAMKLEQDKALAKQHVLDSGLNTSPYSVVSKNSSLIFDDIKEPGLAYPLFVKPLNKGGGQGVDMYSVVNNQKELSRKISSISNQQNCDSLVENYFAGREFSICILGGENNFKFLAMPLELIVKPDKNGSRMLSKKIKSADAESVLLIKDTVLNQVLENFGTEIFKAINARDYGRIDVRLDKYGMPQFLEANLVPSLIEDYGSFPKACNLSLKINYRMMINRIVDLAFLRAKDYCQVESLPAISLSLSTDLNTLVC